MSQPWLEDLSEEWVPQPTPQAARDAPATATPQTSQSVPSKTKSRLPRLRQSSGSFSEIRVRRGSNDLRPPKRRSALAERSLSDNNLPSADASELVSLRDASQSFSAISLDAFACEGTVAQKPVLKSSSNDKSAYETPEWRRRLLQGEIGYGAQKDLFSPTGLENIFQKPNEPDLGEKVPKRRGGVFKGLSAMPSSPPPWPAHEEDSAQDDSAMQHDDHTQQDESEVPAHDRSESMVEESALKVTEASVNSLEFDPGPLRTVSGQIEYENENFSPVYLTHHFGVGPRRDPVPNFRGSELAQRLRHLGSPLEQQDLPTPEEESINQSQADSSFSRLQDDSLPEDLPAGTPSIADMTDVGRFVEMKRGGYSRDGSFRTRPLSPSPERAKKQSGLRTETLPPVSVNAIAASDKPTGQADADSMSPKTPRRGADSDKLSPERAKGSGSPLKLFDAHDTFTSNRLQRRLSQLEYKPDRIEGSVSSSLQTNRNEVTKIHKEVRLTSVEEVSMHKDGASPQRRRVSTFGEGGLNKYEFSGDFSVVSSHDGEESGPDESPSTDIAPPGSRPPVRFNYDASPSSREPSRARRAAIVRVASQYRAPSRTIPQIVRQSSNSTQPEVLEDSSHEYAEGKRGPTSPFKNPTPKRRRTIQKDDEDFLPVIDLQPVQNSRAPSPSVVGLKQKEVRHEALNTFANPEVLARRHILRPRNPTPSQRRLEELHGDILEATEAFIHSSPKMNTIREHMEPGNEEESLADEDRAAIIAEEVAAFSQERQQAMRNDTRKRSVTTQDFLAEAVKIMDFIRAKGKPTSGLGSLAESESENLAALEKPEYPSSSFTFDKPPSRDGRESAWKDPNKPEFDSQKMNHLRKYQEKEFDEFVGSSFRSLDISRMRGVSGQEENSILVNEEGIRISDNLDRNDTPITETNHGHSHGRMNGSHPSMMSSMGNTVATSTSRKSDHVNTLAPQAVAHLIPQEVAGMSFDPKKNIWVRQKVPSSEHRIPEEHSATNESEEDPFGNIPDLTVDESAERRLDKPSPARPQPTAETFLEDTEDTPQALDDKARPVTRDGAGTVMTDSSSAPSKLSNFAWSLPKTETRASSYSDQETVKGGTQKLHRLPPATYTIPESDEDDIEHEIKYFEGRAAQPPVRDARVRNVTISIAQQEFDELRENADHTKIPQKQASRRWSAIDPRQHSSPHKGFWNNNKGVQTYPHRSVRDSVFEDVEDLSILDERPQKNYRMQLSMSVSGPSLNKSDALMPAPSSPMKGDVTFMLSDLPDFTLNQVDECEIPDRVVIKHDGYKFSKALEDRYALGTADLVKALQDVEPNEPFWEDLREVDLRGKGLENLHRLDDFCYRLEELNASDNKINQVKGIPYAIRRLWVQNNCLTGLTSWMNLPNLQHLDISGNDIDSLDGLSELVHLRTLKVDDNKIQSLQGISCLDGLMELSAARNEIEFVDFAQANLKSLTDLNLRGNQLVEVRNVHRLLQLQHLDLDDNSIEEFPTFDETTERCGTLRSLRVCGNSMVSLDMHSYFPKLESLYADRNSLVNVGGLEDLHHLRTFSVRDQSSQTDTNGEKCINNFLRNPDVRNLYMSLNITRGIELSQHLLNLQRLELASMGLKELPDDFGQLTPNIRSINLNFNSIKDLRPLLNIKRLSELLLVGNKLARLRTNAMVLGKLTTLKKLDWRDNPLTVRFYAPTSENRVMSLRPKSSDEQTTGRFVLPSGDVDQDEHYLTRLDYETRIRRRVTEMMLANFCRHLRELDGLPFDKARVLVKDDIWERLLYLGVIQRKQPDATDEITD